MVPQLALPQFHTPRAKIPQLSVYPICLKNDETKKCRFIKKSYSDKVSKNQQAKSWSKIDKI